MTLNLKAKIYNDETAARKHLESLQWPDGPVCPHCGVVNEATELSGKSTRPGVYKCRPCQQPFSVTVGTVFERSHIPLTKWLLATQLLCSSKKGISSNQLARMLGVTYKTAWFMAHRIRAAMAPEGSSGPLLGGEGKVVQADEMYVGKKSGKRKAAGAGGYGHKITVLSMVEAGGETRSFVLPSARMHEIKGKLRENVHPDSTLHTDGSQAYKSTEGQIVAKHESVDHSKGEYGRDGVSTNMLEGYFSVFKRGLVGTYQHMAEQHLPRYLAEFDFRQNTRAKLGYDDMTRASKVLEQINGKRLTYRRTHAS
jgi:transposase-like protein